jgi:hypothetical protein
LDTKDFRLTANVLFSFWYFFVLILKFSFDTGKAWNKYKRSKLVKKI